MFNGCHVYKSADLTGQNLTAGAAVTFDSEVFDTDAWHNQGSNTSRLTVPSGVSYASFIGNLVIANVTADVVITAEIRKNGSTMSPGAAMRTNINHTVAKVQVWSPPFTVSAGDYFELYLTVQTDTSVDINAGSWFAAWKSPGIATPFSGATVNKAADQSTANYSTLTAVAWDNEIEDVGGWHDNASNNTRLTVPSGVSYVQLAAQIAVQALTANQWLEARIYKNGAALGTPVAINMSSSATILRRCLQTPPIAVSQGDYFELMLQTSSDPSITVTATRSWLSAWKVA